MPENALTTPRISDDRTRPQWLMALLFCAAVGLVCIGPCVAARDDGDRALSEHRLKAVFLYNFTQFVEWPPDAFARPEQPFEICVLGPDPFGTDLDEVVKGESVGGRPLSVRRLRSLAELKVQEGACQILYLGSALEGEKDQAAAAVADLPRRAILTVGDIHGKDTSGLMIAFARENQRIRLRIDGERARAAGLTVSSKLLRIGS